MRNRLVSFVVALSAALAAFPALADGAPPVTVQSRALKLAKRPPGVESSTNLPEDGAIKMPYVTGGAPGVARRINAAVWGEMLEGVPVPTTPGSTFTPPSGKDVQGTSSLDFKATLIPAANPRVLSLALEGEGCGAYCENFDDKRLFDLRDGRSLVLGDLLTPEGFAAVGRRLDAERRAAYRKQLRELEHVAKATATAAKKDADADEDTGNRIAMNKDCLEQVDSQPSTPWWLASEGFALDGRGGITVTKGRCSNHASRALDDVDEVTISIPSAELHGLLTPYGLSVVQQQGDAPAPPPGFDGRELHGRVGGAAVTMKFEPFKDGAETAGWYFYDKYRTLIKLLAHREGGQVIAVEQTASQGKFDLATAGGSLAGTWADKDRRKELPVIVQ
jgi:hypothetical protein